MELIKKYSKPFLDDFLKQITTLGSYQIYIIISILLLILNLNKEFFELALGFIIMHLIGIPIRIIFFRDRPLKKKYSNILEKIAASSMPSFHATRIIFLMFFFNVFFNEKLYIELFLFLLTLIVLYARIYRKRHYPIDILVGIGLGSFSWWIISLLF